MKSYYATEFGAKGDGISDDTAALQRAIDECRHGGGGRIVLDGGRVYRCGAIALCDDMQLYIEEGTTLKASDELSAFDLFGKAELKEVDGPTWNNCDYSGRPQKFFIYAAGRRNISLCGGGKIDGNDGIFFGKVTKYHIEGKFYPRVPLIFFEDCKDVNISGITIERSGFWTVHLVGCDEVMVEGIKIFNNLRLACCDGIDPDHCKNVVIRNCHIEAADDCIVFKTTEGAKKYGACEHIRVSGCRLVSTSAAIKFGSESVSDFNDICISDCVIERSNRGISFQLRDGATARNIRFKGISISTRRFSPVEWWGKGEPIVITAVKRRKGSSGSTIKGVSFEDIRMDCENGIFIYADSVGSIGDISISDSSLFLRNKTRWEKDTHDIRPCEGEGILTQPMNALYVKNASVRLENFTWDADGDMKGQMGDWLYADGAGIERVAPHVGKDAD